MACAAMVVIYLIVVSVGFDWTLTSAHNIFVLFFVLTFSVVLLNRYRRHRAASVLISILPVVFCISLSLFDKTCNLIEQVPINDYYTYRFVILACTLIPLTIFRLDDVKWLVVSLLPGFVALALFDPLHEYFGVGFYMMGYTDVSYFMATVATMVAYLIVVSMSLLSKMYTEGLEKDKEALLLERDASNHNLRHRNAELEKLHQQVKGDSIAMNALNQQLEERVAMRTDELREVIANLEQRNAELERFTYTVSHDLKSPLVTIRGFLGFVEKDLQRGNYNKLLGSIQHIKGASDTMLALIEDLLDLMRLGHITNPSTMCHLADIVAEVKQRLAIQLKQANVHIEVEANMPPIFVDEQRICEMVQNLIENAIKFRGQQAHPLITVGCKTIDGVPAFYVQDNGVGIPDVYQEKVFGLFERLENEVDGTGVGLAIVKRIVELHQGKIWVYSMGKNMGTTFYFTLPVASEPPLPVGMA